MRQTIVGVFDRQEAARAAIEALARRGFPPERIQVARSRPDATAAAVDAPPPAQDGLIGHVRSFFVDMFGDEPQAVPEAAPSVAGTGAVVKVLVDDASKAPTAELELVTAGAVDITHRSA